MRALRPLLTLLALVAAYAPANAQPTAANVFDNMVAAFEDRSSGIDNYTVVSDGFTSHYRKVAGSGPTRYEVGTEVGQAAVGNMTTRFSLDNPYLVRERFATGAAVAGEGILDGAAVWLLKVNPGIGGDVESMQLYVDKEAWVVRGADLDLSDDGEDRSIEIRFEDFRETSGLLYPWRSTARVLGADVDTDQLEKAKEAMEQMEDRLADMPPAQAEMIRSRMEESLKRLEGMTAGEGITSTFTVSEVRVNQGVPADVF